MLKTLKGRVYFLSALIVLPCYFFIYLNFDYSRIMVESELLKTARVVSNQAAENQDLLVSSTQKFLSSLSSLPQIQNPESPLCAAFVSDITPLFERYINIGVPNEQGILTCNGTQLMSPVDVLDRDYIQLALAEKRFTSSGVLVDRVTGRPTMNFAYPVQSNSDSGVILGATVAVISLDWWKTLLGSSQLPANSIAYILDANQQIAVAYPKNIQLDLPSRFNQIIKGEDGIHRAFVKNEVKDTNGSVLLTFVTGVAVDETLSAVTHRYTWIVFTFSMMVLGLLVLLRYFVLNSISKPLRLLSELSLKLGRNEPVERVQPTGVKEMDELQCSFLDMAQRKAEAEKEIIQQSQTDSLTGISNRDALNRKLSDILIDRQNHCKIGVILLDLDNFKEINDTRGHDVGDDVLKMVATRLLECASSAQLVSRYGGDEFILFFEEESVNEAQILALSDKIRSRILEPYTIQDSEVITSASIGVAMYPDDGKNLKELMVAADQAMYLAKQSGRNTVRRFSWDLKEALITKTELIRDLRNAINNKEFYLTYQPIIDRQGAVVKFEALIRWNHPQKGLIPPDKFIQFAEESGQIVAIGDWVIEEAQRALVALRKRYGDHIQIGVNVSPIQLAKQDSENGRLLSSLLMNTDDRVGKREGLVVEITEHLLMNSDESTREVLLAFREKGIQIALDDFGTGYSSLAYIMNYDIDFLKIDIKFVRKLEQDLASQTLCEAIIVMAHALGVQVIAEGVETQQQAERLIRYGCDYLQGYYFSKPVPLEQALLYQQDKVFCVR
ncbi:EAL domain-containing protein [Marinomonas sp. A79]|uniref:EAL domain-containing protein n=1 Tax=Marinomonas vulgaris TaxID=2823372 RepID=A0ABS5HDE5_9GAMM|nr:EAL domain-containing protein [Marinomonas vulgaris]MBR7889413.1 EAL domain-containing protein [Marinomonas vulgaris]